MSLRSFLYAGLCLILVFISACTTTQTKTPPSADIIPELSVAKLSIPEKWTANGRISAIRGEENWYARFSWIQQANDFKIRFTGPLGETQLQISQIGPDILLKTPSIERSSNNLEQLILQETGWVFPVRSLHYWLYGVAEPDIAAKFHYNVAGQISEIVQQGWHIQYSKWLPVGEQTLPKKIIATKNDLKIKIIISQWLLAEQALAL